jgi:hypothetical protein
VPFDEHTVDIARLTSAQHHAEDLRAAMAAYLQHLARRLMQDADAITSVHAQMAALAAGVGGHLRHAQTFAFLMTGWLMFAEFALSVGAITADEVTERLTAVESALRTAAQDQEDASHDVRPDVVFIDTLGDLLGPVKFTSSVPTADYRMMPDSGAGEPKPTGRAAHRRAAGEKVGWVDDEGLYLIPSVATRQIARTLSARGEHLGSTDYALREALRRGRFLRPGNKDHGRRHNRWFEGRSHNVLYLDRQAVLTHWKGERS